jgi:ribosome biogenesis GTPase
MISSGAVGGSEESRLRQATVTRVSDPRTALGWNVTWDAVWRSLDPARGSSGGSTSGRPGRVARLDRGWSTIWYGAPGSNEPVVRARNIGAEVAVGDWVVVSDDGERVELVLPRQSAFMRRASFEGQRAEAHTIAANIDVVFLLHALVSPPNQRRLERELVLAFDSGAQPVLVLTKLDLMDDAEETGRRVATLEAVAPGVSVHVVSGVRGDGLDALREYAKDFRSVALLGASGVGKSTIVNALVGGEVQSTGSVRTGDQRGRHTTTAVQLVALPSDPVGAAGWLIDTPGVRAVSLWSSGTGIERAFADVFALSESCRFRDCKHEEEPDCAVSAAVRDGSLDPRRLDSMKRLVAEEAALEEEQKARLRVEDRRGFRKRKG